MPISAVLLPGKFSIISGIAHRNVRTWDFIGHWLLRIAIDVPEYSRACIICSISFHRSIILTISYPPFVGLAGLGQLCLAASHSLISKLCSYGWCFCSLQVLTSIIIIISVSWILRDYCRLLITVSVMGGFIIAFYCIVVASTNSPTGGAAGLMLLDQFFPDPN
jgi:hypothetical protein